MEEGREKEREGGVEGEEGREKGRFYLRATQRADRDGCHGNGPGAAHVRELNSSIPNKHTHTHTHTQKLKKHTHPL